ncbi:MAG: hypothetical protein ACKV0T_02640 [Planctomycetales bacterium]
MKNVRLANWCIVGCALASLVVFVTTAEAQKTKGKTRLALTKQLMKGLVASNCGDLKKLLDAEQPNWDDVALKAALLNEGGYLLMDDGRCPDGDWAGASKALQTNSADILAAAEKKDLAAAKAAFGKLTAEGCGACHKAHKK